jgi:hypothetical protein
MATTRKRYSAKLKARVAVEAIRGEKTLSLGADELFCRMRELRTAMSFFARIVEQPNRSPYRKISHHCWDTGEVGLFAEPRKKLIYFRTFV